MKYSFVLFDLDGTLLDTAPGVYESHRYAAKKLCLPYPDPENEYKLMGPSLTETALHYYGLSFEKAPDFVRSFREYYDEIGIRNAAPYEGLREILQSLRVYGIKTAVCTMKDEAQAVACMKLFGFSDIFDLIYGIDDENPTDKHTVIERILNDFGQPDRSRVILVGDSPNDGRAAQKSGIDFAAALYGAGFSCGNTLDIPCVCKINHAEELRRFLFQE